MLCLIFSKWIRWLLDPQGVNLSGTGVSANTLHPTDWNVDTEVMVRWGTPGHLYPAKILEI